MFNIVLDLVSGHRLISKVPVPSPPELPEEPLPPPIMAKGEEPPVVRSKEYRVDGVVE